MKNIVLMILWLLILGSCSKKNINATLLGENIYIDNTEVTIGQWLVMMSDVYQKNNKDISILELIPDSTKTYPGTFHLYQWFLDSTERKKFRKVKLKSNLLFKKRYKIPKYAHVPTFEKGPSYLRLPIVGITKEQADIYCRWREEALNRDSNSNKYHVRMLMPIEFDSFSKLFGEQGEFMHYDRASNKVSVDSVNYKGCYLINCRVDSIPLNSPFPYPRGPFPVACFFPDFDTVYDWLGNVAEMTSVKGIAKGGSYMDHASEISKLENISYYSSERWLGFRTICKVSKQAE